MLKKARIDLRLCQIYRKNVRDQKKKRGSLSLDILRSAAEYTFEWSAATTAAATISSAAATISSAAATISSAAAAGSSTCSGVSCTTSSSSISHVTLCTAT